MAIEETDLGFWVPDGNERVKDGDNVIARNAQKAQEHLTKTRARIGVAEAKIDAGAGGPGLSEDPENPGLYYFAGPAFAADPAQPGLYQFEVVVP